MTLSIFRSSTMRGFLSLVLLVCFQLQVSSQEEARVPASKGYRQTWALIIGVDYQGRQDDLDDLQDRIALTPLRNAANDAKALAAVLTELYDYPADEQHVRLLTEEGATFEAIETGLGHLCDAKQVGPEDSVLVFFAGHGVRIDSQTDRAAILAYDVQLSAGRPTAKYIPLHSYLFNRLRNCPAKHKLVVLDCCYSGEIFHTGFQARSETDDRGDIRLAKDESFQAIASCRATQISADGTDDHSPFSSALLEGLRRLPAQENGDRRVWSNRLLSHIRPKFMGSVQKPDCRSLVGSEGEFCFYPSSVEKFSAFKVAPSEQMLLSAMVTSRQGDWWFNETPWYIPGIREQIINELESTADRSRSSGLVQAIAPLALRSAAIKAMDRLSKGSEVERLRASHCKALLESQGTSKFKNTLEQIALDLSTDTDELDSNDLHLLAIVEHALGRKSEARSHYEELLKRHEGVPDAERRTVDRVLHAIARSDFGELLLEQYDDAREAVAQFHTADEEVRILATGETGHSAGAFRIFVLCREAEGWLRQNRWSEANERIIAARDLAETLIAKDYLTSFVYRQLAWAYLIQWEVEKANGAFKKSNEILAEMLLADVDGIGESANTSPAAPESAPTTTSEGRPSTDLIQGLGEHFTSSAAFARVFDQSNNYSAKIAYFHNIHGMAMVKRFRGDSDTAAQDYRHLFGRINTALAQFKRRSSDSAIESQFLVRLVNTQERLGDCNLFGVPSIRSLDEAADDYRRASSWVHRLTPIQRDKWRTVLLYKQALALALSDSPGDHSIAMEMCQRADELFEKQSATAVGQHAALGFLAQRIVRVAVGMTEISADSSSASDELRAALEEFRDQIGAAPHRDELEIGLFGSRVLLELGNEGSHLTTLEDVDLLLAYCRLALKGIVSSDDDLEGAKLSESVSYLRPYYDVAVQVRMRIAPSRVKQLIELQWEATRGTVYVKPLESVPTLAMYNIGKQCFLFCDVPGEKGSCICLSETYDMEDLLHAGRPEQDRINLPIAVLEALESWRRDRAGAAGLVSVNCVPDQSSVTLPQSDGQGVLSDGNADLGDAFPFKLPAPFKRVALVGIEAPIERPADSRH